MKKRLTVTLLAWTTLLLVSAHPALAGIQNMG
jgi:hypothetical protein